MSLEAPLPAPAARTLHLDAAAVLAVGLALTGACACALTGQIGFGPFYLPAALAIFGAIAFSAFLGLGGHRHSRFGLANIITTFRAVLAALIGAALTELAIFRAGGSLFLEWAIPIAALVALLLDGIDGYAARRSGRCSAFGVRYDMEVDALLILLLAVLAAGLGKAGPWVILIGAMRYVFVAAGRIVPVLRAELPPSTRRKAGCVVQVATLCVVLTPFVTPPLSALLCLSALLFLLFSFTIDVIWLLGRKA